jgi:hypothetical protein
MMLMLAATLAFFQSSSPPPKVKVAYVARGSLPGLNPPLEKAIGDWLNVQTVEFQASSLDPSVMYLPNEIAQDVCSRSGMQTVLSGYGFISHPTSSSRSTITLAITEYDCPTHTFTALAEQTTPDLPVTSTSALTAEYQSTLKRLLIELAPPSAGPGAASRTS